MSTVTRIGTTARMSRIVVHGDIVHLSGQTTDERQLDFSGQLESTLAKIDRCLADAGTDRTNLLSAQIWLKDINRDFSVLNEVWEAWIPAGSAPTRATAQCEMALPEILVEIIVTAVLPPLTA